MDKATDQVKVQIVIDRDLLQKADEIASASRLNRSAFVRDALRQHIRRLHAEALEAQHRIGYEKHPQSIEEIEAWAEVQAWPED